MGIWQHVSLQATGAVRVTDPAAFTEVSFPDAKEAKVSVRCMVENFTDIEKEVGLKNHIVPVGFTDKEIDFKTICKIPPKTTQEIKLTPDKFPLLIMQNLQVWWPVNYGDQPLYKRTVEATVDDKISSKAENNFGVFTVGTCVLPSGGRAFMVNGQIIRLVGGAWVPCSFGYAPKIAVSGDDL
jgi:hypothetical protein